MNNDFWTANVDDIKKGYIYNEANEEYKCLICNKTADSNEIFKIGERFFNAERYIEFHIASEHENVLSYLINLDKKYTNLTENQKNIIIMINEGQNDREISSKCNCSSSTIRNYRFQFREKEKQAKIQLAIYELLNSTKTKTDKSFINFSPGINITDERFAITKEEYDKIISSYFKNGKLIQFPTKQKRIIIILKYVSMMFNKTKKYSEKEVNNIIASVYSDYATIRRYLIEYGFMLREKDCSYYWLNLGGEKDE